MADLVASYAESLPEGDRALLLSSIPFLISLCVGADRNFDELEVRAAVDVLVDSTDVLGDPFRYSPAAQEAFDVISERAREGWTDASEARLAALGAIVRAMPQRFRTPYQDFVAKMCVDLVSSSGGFLWFGEPISDPEKSMLSTIVDALGIPRIGALGEALH